MVRAKAVATVATVDELEEEILETYGLNPDDPRQQDEDDDEDFNDPEDDDDEQDAIAEQTSVLAHLQDQVPFKVIVQRDGQINSWEQTREVDQWADDQGAYPRQYRSYSREEWTAAINLLAETVTNLATTHPDFQRTTGLYVEEHTPELLLINGKRMVIKIEIPTKAKLAGKKFEVLDAAGYYSYGQGNDKADRYAELLSYCSGEDRELLMDIACQYMRDLRIRTNKRVWAEQNPELAAQFPNQFK